MSKFTTPYNNDFDVNIEYNEYAIGGKLIIASTNISSLQIAQMKNDERDYIREELVRQLAGAMIDSKLVEITSMSQPHTMDHLVRARCYVAPDSTVKLLRILKKETL